MMICRNVSVIIPGFPGSIVLVSQEQALVYRRYAKDLYDLCGQEGSAALLQAIAELESAMNIGPSALMYPGSQLPSDRHGFSPQILIDEVVSRVLARTEIRPCNILITGKPGTGKTFLSEKIFPDLCERLGRGALLVADSRSPVSDDPRLIFRLLDAYQAPAYFPRPDLRILLLCSETTRASRLELRRQRDPEHPYFLNMRPNADPYLRGLFELELWPQADLVLFTD